MKQINSNTGMRFAVIVSLFCHVFCFKGIEFTFGNNKAAGEGSKFSKIFFLGPILQESVDYYSPSTQESDYSQTRLNARIFTPLEIKIANWENKRFLTGFTDILTTQYSPIYELSPDFKKPPLADSVNHKIAYFESSPVPKMKKADSSIMFYPAMPYHFLLYFKDRQIAHMEATFYISSTGKIAGIKRKISSGNPEVDLLIMRNLTHFLNLCKSNFALGSWQTVKIDLSR